LKLNIYIRSKLSLTLELAEVVKIGVFGQKNLSRTVLNFLSIFCFEVAFSGHENCTLGLQRENLKKDFEFQKSEYEKWA
jgi:hypothetical protein